ncbi:hypothetical protein BS78_01G036200 [Paspalum vaginatum]|nr:hypothetical protein BS78_01G036200 [Paspalum vaginatum]
MRATRATTLSSRAGRVRSKRRSCCVPVESRDMWDMVPAIDLHRGLVVSVSSLLIMLVLQPLAENVASASRGIRSASRAALRLLARDDSLVVLDDHDDNGGGGGGGGGGGASSAATPRHCERCASRPDVAAVMASLRLDYPVPLGGGDDKDDDDDEAWCCGGCAEMAAVEELLERKVASEAELREAFYVFDRDEDGFVGAEELWNVMRRLGFAEGATREGCRRMIAAHDADADGRISFPEFRAMMESAA